MSMSWRLRRPGSEDAVLLSRLEIKTYSLNYRGILPDDMLDGAGPDNP
tara:strand:+ start:8734 stop:8877 length:144 start_codon:yes stop_codon:yes gene_type:complete